MKPAPFQSTPEFSDFSAVMKRLMRVSKAEMDQALRKQKIKKANDKPNELKSGQKA